MMKKTFGRLAALLMCAVCLAGLSACKEESSAPVGETSSSASDSSKADSSTPPALSDPDAMPENTYSAPTMLCDNIVVKAGTEKVPYRVILYQNPGYAFTGFRILYDDALTPYTTDDMGTVEMVTGDALSGFMSTCINSDEDNMIGFGAFCTEDKTTDGIVFTCYFDIPADAASGTVYPFTLEVVDFNTLAGEAKEVQAINGAITVQ